MFIPIDTIIRIVSKITELEISAILSKCRTRELCYARAIIVNLARKNGYTYQAIGKAINRNYSTCIKNADVLFNDVSINPFVKHLLNQCSQEIKNLESLAMHNINAGSISKQET
jgi:chromosomal replication initiation ATPase DnaA